MFSQTWYIKLGAKGSEVNIVINGKRADVADNLTVEQLLIDLDYKCEKVAVAVNSAFVPRSAYAETFVKDGDGLDVVAPVQGG